MFVGELLQRKVGWSRYLTTYYTVYAAMTSRRKFLMRGRCFRRKRTSTVELTYGDDDRNSECIHEIRCASTECVARYSNRADTSSYGRNCVTAVLLVAGKSAVIYRKKQARKK